MELKIVFLSQLYITTTVPGGPFLKIHLKKPLGCHFHMYCQFIRTLYCAVHSGIALYGIENCFPELIIHNYNCSRWAFSQNPPQETSMVSFLYVLSVYKVFVLYHALCIAVYECILICIEMY